MREVGAVEMSDADAGKPATMLRSRTSQVLALVAINLVGLALLVVGIELAFGNWFTPYVAPNHAVVNRTYVYRQELYQPHGKITYSRDKYGLRGVHEPLPQVELVTVGGSTTDQRYIGEGETWQDVLRARSGIAVANAGSDGMSSFGHLVAVTEWLHRIPDFAPRYYLHYIGVNDAALSNEPSLSDRSGSEGEWSRSLRRRSFILTAVENLWFKANGPRVVSHGAFTMPAGHRSDEMVKAKVDTRDIENYIANSYKPNLRKLIALHRSHNEKVILLSQPANPALIQWRGPDTYVAAWNAALGHWAVALRMINEASRSVCEEEAADICRFVDLAGAVTFEPADYYDLVHATPSGARKIGDCLAGEVALLRGK